MRDDLAAHVAAGRTALILDLRGDPGGYVTAARMVASEFIGSGPIFWEQDAKGGQLETDGPARWRRDGPDAAGRLPHRRRERLGERDRRGRAPGLEAGDARRPDSRSARGPSSSGPELTGEGGAFKLTIARWLTPDKRWIHKVGLTPDVVVDAARGHVPPGATRPSTRRSRSSASRAAGRHRGRLSVRRHGTSGATGTAALALTRPSGTVPGNERR